MSPDERRAACVKLAEVAAGYVEASVFVRARREQVVKLARSLVVNAALSDEDAIKAAGKVLAGELAAGVSRG